MSEPWLADAIADLTRQLRAALPAGEWRRLEEQDAAEARELRAGVGGSAEQGALPGEVGTAVSRGCTCVFMASLLQRNMHR